MTQIAKHWDHLDNSSHEVQGLSSGDSKAEANVQGTYTWSFTNLTFSQHGIQLGSEREHPKEESLESGFQENKEETANLLLTVPLRNLIASVLFHLIGFNPVIKANSDLRAGKSDSISSWGVTGSQCRRSCGMGDIFVANFGKYNLPQNPCCLVHICSLYYSTFFV